MKAVSVLSVLATVVSVQAWWDNGHQLVGEVATQLLAKEDVATIQSVLGTWNDDYPNTGEITTATIWADLIKCESVKSTYCPSPTKPAVRYMDDWHYVNLPTNVNGSDWHGLTSKDVDLLIKAILDGRGLYTLQQSLRTIAKSKSAWSANFVLRFFLHVFGDVHQPCHSTVGISDKFPDGDVGGNLYRFVQPCSASNLHAIWDNAAGTFTSNWHPTSLPGSPDRLALTANATALLQKYADKPDVLNYAQYAKLSYADFTKAVATDKVLEKTFLETYDVARSVVYVGLDLTNWTESKVACPSAAYQATLVATVEARIVLAGKRMAVVLAQFAKQFRAQGLAQ
ncbi:hypothetical protein DYB38_012523 [Aphanomyces astaci]|uniref:S1/P1 nuclease n=1 Tax=Aphanomyces astaci TaxID=112090 RepID=A0A397B7N8_APHAT|nr:hypothetical protein DYB36_006159 [Aphanomyces astaci]RHY42116.1 hypothetical protein DYB38_012523 [Aphanomyces astaci]RHY78340.1 hypothetical protein DYB34_001185 [Aphanomyces astaci]RHZ16328.1 hypothetical protein DYB31_009860 [Aphanomyces astaci]